MRNSDEIHVVMVGLIVDRLRLLDARVTGDPVAGTREPIDYTHIQIDQLITRPTAREPACQSLARVCICLPGSKFGRYTGARERHG